MINVNKKNATEVLLKKGSLMNFLFDSDGKLDRLLRLERKIGMTSLMVGSNLREELTRGLKVGIARNSLIKFGVNLVKYHHPENTTEKANEVKEVLLVIFLKSFLFCLPTFINNNLIIFNQLRLEVSIKTGLHSLFIKLLFSAFADKIFLFFRCSIFKRVQRKPKRSHHEFATGIIDSFVGPTNVEGGGAGHHGGQ